MARFPSLAFVALCRSPNRSPRGWAVTDNAQPVNADDDLNSDPEMNRRIAGVVFGFYSDALKLCFESIAAMARWMLTALVAINGGAAVAVGGIHMPADSKVAACGLFVLGIILALGA